MEDKLVTLAILTYSKAQILKTILENEGIEVYIHNVNQIQPFVSSGVRVRIKESDLASALRITESSSWLAEAVVGESLPEKPVKNFILIPIDFSSYSLKACDAGFRFAHLTGADVVLLHVYYTPMFVSSLPYGDIFNYEMENESSVQTILESVQDKVNHFVQELNRKIEEGSLPPVNFCTKLREGIPEEEILKYAKNKHPRLIVMGTKGGSKRDLDLIGSVTAEVIERSTTTVLAIPENSQLNFAEEINRIAFLTNFNQRDLIAFDSLIRQWNPINIQVSFIHLADGKDTWDEIKLGGIKEYFSKQYSNLTITYDIVPEDELLDNLEKYISAHKIGLMVMTTYKRNIFARLFNPGMARKMVFHSRIPLLVIK